MKRFRKILVATDTRYDDHPIVEEAAEIARHNGARLTIVDGVPELPWTVRLTLSDHEHVSQLMAEEKGAKLEALAQAIRATGLEVDTKVLQGKASVEIIRQVIRGGHDLVMRIAKGRTSRQAGFFGRTAVLLLRKCPCPVWLVAPGTTPEFKHVAGCVDTTSDNPADEQLNDKVFELASSISHYHEGRFSVIHVWSILGEQLIQHHMKEKDFETMEHDTQKHAEACFKKFLARHGSSIDAGHVHLLKGDAAPTIADFVKSQGVDLLVMGTVARSGVSGLVMGNTAEQILSRIECSVLALKPEGFVSPVRLPAS